MRLHCRPTWQLLSPWLRIVRYRSGGAGDIGAGVVEVWLVRGNGPRNRQPSPSHAIGLTTGTTRGAGTIGKAAPPDVPAVEAILDVGQPDVSALQSVVKEGLLHRCYATTDHRDNQNGSSHQDFDIMWFLGERAGDRTQDPVIKSHVWLVPNGTTSNDTARQKRLQIGHNGRIDPVTAATVPDIKRQRGPSHSRPKTGRRDPV